MEEMINVTTTRFGEIRINPDDIYIMPEGILGFSSQHRYVIIDHHNNSFFKWLQCVDKPDLAFVIANPASFMPDYGFELSQGDMDIIKLEKEEDCIVAVILVIPKDPELITANLKGPIVFNVREKLAKQLVLADSEYSVEYRIFGDSE